MQSLLLILKALSFIRLARMVLRNLALLVIAVLLVSVLGVPQVADIARNVFGFGLRVASEVLTKSPVSAPE